MHGFLSFPYFLLSTLIPNDLVHVRHSADSGTQIVHGTVITLIKMTA